MMKRKNEENGRLGLSVVTVNFRITLPEKVREFLDLKDDGTDYLLFYPTKVLSQKNNDENKGLIIYKLPKGMIKEETEEGKVEIKGIAADRLQGENKYLQHANISFSSDAHNVFCLSSNPAKDTLKEIYKGVRGEE